MKIKSGDVILFKNCGSKLGNIIQKTTGSPWIHVGIVFDVNESNVCVAEAKNRGFVLSVYHEKDLQNKEYYKIKRPVKQLKNVDVVMTQYIGKSYDFWQLVNIWLYTYLKIRLPGDGAKDLICSEAVARVLKDCNKNMDLGKEFDVPLDYVTPAMINDSKLLKGLE